jgi:glycosyltransferase involved in cell wall biosynthesis
LSTSFVSPQLAQPVDTVHDAGQPHAASSIMQKMDRVVDAMHIVHIIKHCGYGNGNVHVAVDLACMQAAQGNRVTFVSCGGTFEPLLAQYGVKHITLKQEQRSPLGMMKAVWKLATFARRERPTVLHAHMMSSAVVGWFASKVSGIPLVTTVHNSFDRHSRLMSLGKQVVAVSLAERESLRSIGYKSSRLAVVRNAPCRSPRENFMQNKGEIELRRPCILAANGLHRRKGVADLIQACSTALPGSPAWHLYLAGEGPDRQILEDEVRSLGLSERVTFLGFVPAPRTLMEQADIFVLASYADPCSLAIGEARAAGCAIVATAVGGTPEMLDFGSAGRLISPGNPSQLADALKELMQNDEVRHSLRQAAKTGSEVFDVEQAVLGYARVYRSAQNA